MLENLKSWWAGLPTWGKYSFVAVILAIVVYGLYKWKTSASTSSTLPVSEGAIPSGTATTGTDTSGSTTDYSSAISQLGNSITALSTQEQNDVSNLEQGLVQTNSQFAGALQQVQRGQGSAIASAISSALSPISSQLQTLTSRIASMGVSTAGVAVQEGPATTGGTSYASAISSAQQEVAQINTAVQRAGGSALTSTEIAADTSSQAIANAGLANTQAGQAQLAANLAAIQAEHAAQYYQTHPAQ